MDHSIFADTHTSGTHHSPLERGNVRLSGQATLNALLHFSSRALPLNLAVALPSRPPRAERILPLPEGALCLIAATTFCVEYLLFYFHSTSHQGLEGYYHLLLVLLIGFCILATVTGAFLPTSFPVDFCSGIAITVQGLWFYQTTFTLYGRMMPDGCQLKENAISCHSTDYQV
ncbi:hypothetical protein ACSBR1_001956 [Camellia fascicularis]